MTKPFTAPAPVMTVITPTYNRAHLLDRVYQSLLDQTDHSFEWIIIDDGSTDDTVQVVTPWIAEAPFSITYVKQDNQGKPAAFNHAVRLAKGSVLACLDSDDWFPEDAVKNHIALIDIYGDRPEICGVVGININSDGVVVGSEFPKEGMIASKQSLSRIAPGDKSNAFKTEVLKKFPFPIFHEEKFIAESAIYNRMFESGYRFASTNKVLKMVEYQLGGLSDSALSIRINSLNGTILYYSEMSLMDFSSFLIVRSKANLVRYTLHKLNPLTFCFRAFLFLLALPIGVYLYISDVYRLRRK